MSENKQESPKGDSKGDAKADSKVESPCGWMCPECKEKVSWESGHTLFVSPEHIKPSALKKGVSYMQFQLSYLEYRQKVGTPHIQCVKGKHQVPFRKTKCICGGTGEDCQRVQCLLDKSHCQPIPPFGKAYTKWHCGFLSEDGKKLILYGEDLFSEHPFNPPCTMGNCDHFCGSEALVQIAMSRRANYVKATVELKTRLGAIDDKIESVDEALVWAQEGLNSLRDLLVRAGTLAEPASGLYDTLANCRKVLQNLKTAVHKRIEQADGDS